jgi:hypothetical protein
VPDRCGHARSPRRSSASVGWTPDEPDIADASALNDIGTAVGRAIVDHDDLEVLERLRKDAVQGATDFVHAVEDRDDDTHP